MTIKDALKKANLKLATGSFDTPHLDTELLLAHVLKKTKEFLGANPECKLTKSQKNKFGKLVLRRLNKEPVAYLIGKKWFFGNEFIVNKNVLIPRPEAEIICEQVLEISEKYKIRSVLDAGTGSGNIAVSLAVNMPESIKFTATDISNNVLNVAKRNAKKMDCINKIDFIKSNLFEKINSCFDVIVANLPYVPAHVPVETGEPEVSLYGGQRGTELYNEFFSQIKDYLNTPGHIIIEIDSPAHAEMRQVIKKFLPDAKIRTEKDLAQMDRILVIHN